MNDSHDIDDGDDDRIVALPTICKHICHPLILSFSELHNKVEIPP